MEYSLYKSNRPPRLDSYGVRNTQPCEILFNILETFLSISIRFFFFFLIILSQYGQTLC